MAQHTVAIDKVCIYLSEKDLLRMKRSIYSKVYSNRAVMHTLTPQNISVNIYPYLHFSPVSLTFYGELTMILHFVCLKILNSITWAYKLILCILWFDCPFVYIITSVDSWFL